MLYPDFNENENENTEITGLIELFERFLASGEQFYFDEDSLERILEYYEMQSRPERAEAVADYAINQNPYSSDFLIRKAEFLLNRKKYKEALEFLDKAALFDTGEVDVYLIRSDVYVETNQIDKAEQTLYDALKIADDEEKDIIYAELSDIYEMQENFEKAFECLTSALEINPRNEDALYKLSHIVDMTDAYGESVTIHKNITEKEPYSWLAWYNLGRAYMGLGLYENAIEAFEFVMAIDDNFDLVYRDAADIYYRMADYPKAIEMFEIAQEKSGGFEDYSFRIGLCFEQSNNFKTARYHYRKAARQDPYLHEAFFRIGETYRLEERYEAALVNYKKALKLDESNEDYIVKIIMIYKIIDKDDDVIFYLNWLVNARPDILNYWLDYIIYLFDIAKFGECVEVINDALQRCGQYTEFYYMQSAALFYAGKEKECLSVLEHALITDYSRHIILYEVCNLFASNEKVQRLINAYAAG